LERDGGGTPLLKLKRAMLPLDSMPGVWLGGGRVLVDDGGRGSSFAVVAVLRRSEIGGTRCCSRVVTVRERLLRAGAPCGTAAESLFKEGVKDEGAPLFSVSLKGEGEVEDDWMMVGLGDDSAAGDGADDGRVMTGGSDDCNEESSL